MHELIYTSVATQDFTTDELIVMLKSFREHNKEIKISGILVYYDREFIQLLEGKKETIHNLYNKICQDQRHTNIKIFHEAPITQRSFSDWSMGFINADQIDPDYMTGFSNILKKGAIQPDNNDSIGSHLFLSLCTMMHFDNDGTMQD